MDVGYSLDKSEIRENFGYFVAVQTRWNDLDAYRHLNNARYYTFFDTAIMNYLRIGEHIDALEGPIVPYTVENSCRYFQPFTFPDVVEVGLRVAHLGTSSVRYEIGLFKAGHAAIHAAGYFVDVFVDTHTQAPQPIPPALKQHLSILMAPRDDGRSSE